VTARGMARLGAALALAWLVLLVTSACFGDPIPAGGYKPSVCDRAMAEGTSSGCSGYTVSR
jgi:hypothetical protein